MQLQTSPLVISESPFFSDLFSSPLWLIHPLLSTMSSRDKGSSSSPAMDNETYVKNRIQELVRLIKVARVYRQDNVPSLIQQGLYLGSFAAASNKNALKSCNVTHILTEDTNLEAYFDECIHFIDEAKKQGGSVLVHCFVGKSRSVTIVVAYLMKKHGMTLTQALQHVQSIRPVANPNAGFIRQLQDLEKSLQGKQESLAHPQV
ncbi:hypothetical protein HID58_002749 [Brassica napus]|uniref:protein-tyrosine-phosphatase n=1 Tax=Brassica napus TaxID=3708 RepID=A0ABQ8EN85_BRANA|nr:hypothetical protein HID58_002749 [Brassica napus]